LLSSCRPKCRTNRPLFQCSSVGSPIPIIWPRRACIPYLPAHVVHVERPYGLCSQPGREESLSARLRLNCRNFARHSRVFLETESLSSASRHGRGRSPTTARGSPHSGPLLPRSPAARTAQSRHRFLPQWNLGTDSQFRAGMRVPPGRACAACGVDRIRMRHSLSELLNDRRPPPPPPPTPSPPPPPLPPPPPPPTSACSKARMHQCRSTMWSAPPARTQVFAAFDAAPNDKFAGLRPSLSRLSSCALAGIPVQTISNNLNTDLRGLDASCSADDQFQR